MYAFMKDSITRNDQEKIYYYGNRIRAEKLLSDIDATAAFLQKSGIKKGDSVGICLPNIPQAAIALYAVNMIGAVANVIHPKTGSEALKSILKKTKTRVVFLFDRFLKRHIEGNDGVIFICCRMSDYMKGVKKSLRLTEPAFFKRNIVQWAQVLKNGGAKEYACDGSEAAVYLHSSGTTGEPKTVVLSSYAFNELAVNNYETVKHCCKIDDKISILMILPLFHGFGLGISVHLAMHKGRSIMVPVFRAKSTVNLMRKEEVNVIPGVPGMFRRLYEQKNFKGDFLKNIRLMFCGGDKLDSELKKNFEKRLKEYGCETPIMEGYGLSEAASVVTINVFDPDNGSLGQGINSVKLKVFDGDRECEPYECGEIFINSPSIMIGYLDGSDSKIKDLSDGKWLGSGDVGYLDENGCLYFKERIKRLVKIGGVNVFPAEIEETALKYPHIKRACAVRIKLNGKAAVKLLIVTDVKDNRMKNSLKEFIARKLTPYAVPKIVDFVKEIKTTELGKADYAYYEKREG